MKQFNVLTPYAGEPYAHNLIEVAVYGDSRLAGTHSNTTNYSSQVENAMSPAGWVSVKTDGKVVFPADLNFAVGGDTTTDMLARLSSVAQSRADIVLILASTNDRGSAAMTADATIANFRTMLNALSHKTVWFIAELPRGDSTYTSNRLSAPQLQYHAKVRTWLREVAPNIYPNVVTFDCYPDFAQWDSTTGDAILGYLHDGLHLSTRGAEIAALPIAAYVNAYYPTKSIAPTTNSDGYSTDNPYGWLNSNPLFTSTGGSIGSGGSGTIAANWVFARNSAAAAGTVAAALSKVATPGGDWQQLVITGNTVSNSGPQFSLHQDIVLGNLSVADVLIAIGQIEVDAGAAGIIAAQLSVRTENPTVYESKSLDRRDAANPYPTTLQKGTHVTPYNIYPPVIPTVCRVRCIVDMAENYTGVNATIRFRRVGVRKTIPQI